MFSAVGAIHRYYESRRRVHNDSQPHRREAVAKNKEKAKRKGYRTRVCSHTCYPHTKYVTRFAKTGHNSAFIEIHFIAQH